MNQVAVFWVEDLEPSDCLIVDIETAKAIAEWSWTEFMRDDEGDEVANSLRFSWKKDDEDLDPNSTTERLHIESISGSQYYNIGSTDYCVRVEDIYESIEEYRRPINELALQPEGT